MGTVLEDGLARVRLRGFASAFDRLAKSKYFELHLRGFLLIVVVLLVVASVRDQLFHLVSSWL